MDFLFKDVILRYLMLNLLLIVGFGLGYLQARRHASIKDEKQVQTNFQMKLSKVTDYTLIILAIIWILSTLTYVIELILRFFGVISIH